MSRLKNIVTRDGTVERGIHTLRLGGGLSLARNADAPSATLDVASAGWVRIDQQIMTGTTYTAPTWAPGTYRLLKLILRSSGSGAATSAVVTLTGLTGAYTHGNIYTQAGGAPTSDANAGWTMSWDAKAWATVEIDIARGGPRSMFGFNRTSTPIRQFLIADNDDTTHDVTGLVVTMLASGTFEATLMGLPSDEGDAVITLTDIAITAGKPRVVTEDANGYLWFPDLIGLSTGELVTTVLKSADSFDNTTNSFDVFAAPNQDAPFQFSRNTPGFNAGCGQPTIALPNGTAVGGRQYFLTPSPNNGTATTTFTCDRLTYSAGAMLTSEPNAITITFPEAVKPYAGSATMGAYAFWFGRIVDIGGGTWVTTLQWVPDSAEDTKRVAACFRSTDQGYTWTYIGEIGSPADVPESTDGFSEPAICKLADGRLFATSRVGGGMAMWEAYSSDGGVTWTTPVESTHPACAAPSLITLRNGVTVELAGIGVSAACGMTFRFTRDNGATWSSWDAMAYHNARAIEDPGLSTPFTASTTTNYFGIQEVSPNRVAVIYDYLPGGRPAQPGNGTLTAEIYLLQFDVVAG